MWHERERQFPDHPPDITAATAVVLKWGLDVSSSDPAACNNLYVGGDHNNGGTGYSTELRLLGGSLNVSGSAYIGGDQSGGYMCDIEQFDGTTLTAPSEYVGFDNSVAQYTQTGGLNSVGALLLAAICPPATATPTNFPPERFSVCAGGITLAGSSGTSALNLGGGTLQATADFSSSIDMPLTATSTIDTNSHAMTLSVPSPPRWCNHGRGRDADPHRRPQLHRLNHGHGRQPYAGWTGRPRTAGGRGVGRRRPGRSGRQNRLGLHQPHRRHASTELSSPRKT